MTLRLWRPTIVAALTGLAVMGMAGTAQATVFNLFQDTSGGIFVAAPEPGPYFGVLFELEEQVTFDNFGILINPIDHQSPFFSTTFEQTTFIWRLFESNTSGGLVGICCTVTIMQHYSDQGPGTYWADPSTDVVLDSGIYQLQFSNVGGLNTVQTPNISESQLPLTVGPIDVLNGAARQSGGIFADYSTTLLPAFSVSIVTPNIETTVPEPSSLALFACALAGMTIMLWRRRQT